VSPILADAIDRALGEIERGRREGWRSLDGSPADGQLSKLREDLIALTSGAEFLPQGHAMTRWVLDWIPSTDDPLVHAVAEVERLAQAV